MLWHEGDECPLCNFNKNDCDKCVIGNGCEDTPFMYWDEAYCDVENQMPYIDDIKYMVTQHKKMITYLERLLKRCVVKE